MKVKDILEHFISRADWVNPENTVDRVIIGDPEKDVKRCLVTWMPGFSAVRHAVEESYDLLLCHEPTFWNHKNDNPANNPYTQEKYTYIKNAGLTILRNHDCWDRWPDIGIPFAWAQFLDFASAPAVLGNRDYQHRYDIDPVSVESFARKVAQKCSQIGEPSVQVTGDLNKIVSKIGIGTGCACKIEDYMDMGCDCFVVCDDGSCYWSGIQMAEDMGYPVIRVNHGTSEEPGMVTLTRYINENLDVRADHHPHGATFKLIE